MVGTLIFGYVLYELFTPFKAVKWVDGWFKKFSAGLNADELTETALDSRCAVNRAYLDWQDAMYGHMDSLLPFWFVQPGQERPDNAKFQGPFVLTRENYNLVCDAIRRDNEGLAPLVNVDYLLYAGRTAWNSDDLREEALANVKRIAAAKKM